MQKKIYFIGLLALIIFFSAACEELLIEVAESATAIEDGMIVLDMEIEHLDGACINDSAYEEYDGEWGKLYRFLENDLWGFKDAYGNIIIEPKYIVARSFS